MRLEGEGIFSVGRFIRLWCRIFGHSFKCVYEESPITNFHETTMHMSREECRCGLVIRKSAWLTGKRIEYPVFAPEGGLALKYKD